MFSCMVFEIQGGRYDPIGDELNSQDWGLHILMATFFFFTVILMLNVLIGKKKKKKNSTLNRPRPHNAIMKVFSLLILLSFFFSIF